MQKRNFRFFCALFFLSLLSAAGCSKEEKPPAQASPSKQPTLIPSTPIPEITAVPSDTGEAPPPDIDVENPIDINEGLPDPLQTSPDDFSGEASLFQTELPDLGKAKALKLGKTVTVTEDKQELYEFTLQEAKLTNERNENADEDLNKLPQLRFTYTYKNLSDETMLLDDMNFYCMVQNDGELEPCPPYYLTTAKSADLAEKGKSCTAELVFTLPDEPEKLDSVTLLLADLAHPKAQMFKYELPS